MQQPPHQLRAPHQCAPLPWAWDLGAVDAHAPAHLFPVLPAPTCVRLMCYDGLVCVNWPLISRDHTLPDVAKCCQVHTGGGSRCSLLTLGWRQLSQRWALDSTAVNTPRERSLAGMLCCARAGGGKAFAGAILRCRRLREAVRVTPALLSQMAPCSLGAELHDCSQYPTQGRVASDPLSTREQVINCGLQVGHGSAVPQGSQCLRFVLLGVDGSRTRAPSVP